MKIILFSCMLFIFTVIESKAQLCQSPCPYYKDFIRLAQADTVKNTQEKLNYYRAATVAAKDCNCSELEQRVNKQIDTLFINIEAQKKMAEAQSYTILEQQKKIEIAFEKAEIANEKNEKIVHAMDFYDGKFALAIKDGKYGFIDKNGNANRNINFIYDKGEPFNSKTGFAKMEINIYDNLYEKYLIDTSGNRYRLINIVEVLREKGIVKSILSKKEISYLKKDLTNNRILSKLNKMESYAELANRKLVSEIKHNSGKIALDFEGTAKDEILSILEFLVKDKIIKDRIELLLFDGLDLDIFPTCITEFKNLKEINMYWTEIKSIPKDICNLKHLKTLRLPSSVTSVPSSLYDLESLEWLDLSFLELKRLPQAVGKLKNLKVIYLPLYLKTLPSSFYDLENLEYLNLRTSRLTELPEAIGNLKNLKKLLLPEEIKRIPASVFGLEYLEEIIIHSRELAEFPEAIGNLKNLKKLTIPEGIKHLPSSILELENLEHLILYSRDLTELPEAIGKLKKLKKLYSYVSLKDLPASIGDLERLEILLLFSSKLKRLPDGIGNLKNLEELYLSDTEIKELPEMIGNLTMLKILKLPTSLDKFPESIGHLIKLKKLIVPLNLEELPKSFFDLKGLEVLDISSEGITKLSGDIGRLTKLEKLTLPPFLEKIPQGIGDLTKLENLVLKSDQDLINFPDLSRLEKRCMIIFTLRDPAKYSENILIIQVLKKKYPALYFKAEDKDGKKIAL